MSRFASVTGLRPPSESLDGRTRKFAGDGTPFLFCPGLKGLERITISGQEIPLQEVRDVVIGASDNGLRTRPVALDLIKLDLAEDNTPVVLRAEESNNGIWQKGAEILVTGEWEPEQLAVPAKPAKSAKADDKKADDDQKLTGDAQKPADDQK